MFLLTASLVGCAGTPFYKAPAIVDISDSKVIVQREHSNLPRNMSASPDTANKTDIEREAKRGCGQYNKKPVLLSESCDRTVFKQSLGNVCMATNYLFYCRD